MNYLGIDFGQRRIGLAISQSGILARGYKTLAFSDNEQIAEEILFICNKEKVGTIVLGLPKLKSGADSPQTKTVREFKDKLREKTNLPIVFVDEYLSSHEAEEMLKISDPKITKDRRKMRGMIDQVAAQVILEQYLKSNNFKL